MNLKLDYLWHLIDKVKLIASRYTRHSFQYENDNRQQIKMTEELTNKVQIFNFTKSMFASLQLKRAKSL